VRCPLVRGLSLDAGAPRTVGECQLNRRVKQRTVVRPAKRSAFPDVNGARKTP